MEGVPAITDLIESATDARMSSLALTDTGGLYGFIPFYKAAKEAGIRPIAGVVLDELVILARNRAGYAQLCRAISAWHKRDGTVFPFVEYLGGLDLFVISTDMERALALRGGGVSVLLGIEPGTSMERRFLEAKANGFRPVAVAPIYYRRREDVKIHRVLAAIRNNTTLGALSPKTYHRKAWFRTPTEMKELYGGCSEALANTDWVAERCDLELRLGTPLFPSVELEEGVTAEMRLHELVREGVSARYRKTTPSMQARIEHELKIIIALGFAPYFLIVWDIVREGRARGISVTGRGSAGNSVVAHVLGLTRADPFRYDLYFERFLSMARRDCPDIDLDICWRRRDELIRYVYDRYGSDRVAMISTLNTFRARSAVREVAKVFGLAPEEIEAVTRRLPHYAAEDIHTLAARLPECRGLRIDREPLRSIIRASECLDGFPRHLSIHSGGMVIAPEPLTNFTPLQTATKGILITQYEMHGIEALGLVKMDLLGNRALTVIRDTVEFVRKNRNMEVDVESAPDPDPLTARMLVAGQTLGCFQIESPAMRALLQHLKADSTDMLIKALSLIRPGPSGSGMKKHFIERHQGLEPVEYPHPLMRDILADTYGVMLYQEDILKVAHAVAGMDLAEADMLRRAMGKKRGVAAMARQMQLFVQKATINGVDESSALAVWELISNFAEYSYCKAHASIYGELSYQCAWLKAHFSGEYLASVLANGAGFYYPAAYMEEARRLGVQILGPDINRSELNYGVEGRDIRAGLTGVRRLPLNTVNSILNARHEGGPYRRVEEFVRRANVSPTECEWLLDAGALDCLGEPRPMLAWRIKGLRGAPKVDTGAFLFEEEYASQVPELPDFPVRQRMQQEWEACGWLFSAHPLQYYDAEIIRYGAMLSNSLPHYAGRRITLAGWLIAERRVPVKGSGCMKFLTFEDLAGVFEAVLFPAAYNRFGHLLTCHGPYIVVGIVQSEYGAYSVNVTGLKRIESSAPFRENSRDNGIAQLAIF